MRILILTFLLLLTACQTVPEVIVDPVVVDRTPLIVPSVTPITQKPYAWIVITENNINQIFADMKSQNKLPILYAIEPGSYEIIQLNEAETRRYILQTGRVLEAYQTYYRTNDGREEE